MCVCMPVCVSLGLENNIASKQDLTKLLLESIDGFNSVNNYRMSQLVLRTRE